MRKNYRLIILTSLLLVFALIFVACGTSGSSGSSSNIGKYYEYDGSTKNANSWIELKSGGKWTDGDDSGTYSVSIVRNVAI